MTDTNIEHDAVAATTLTARQLDIVTAATRVFANHGYRGGTIQMIAEEAGLSQPGLIHHFPNKSSILLAVVRQRDIEDRQAVQDARESGCSAIEAFRQVLAKNAKLPELMLLFEVLATEALNPDHPAHDFFQQRMEQLLARTTAAIEQDQQQGIVRDDLPAQELAAVVIAAANGLRYQRLVGIDPVEHWEHFGVLEHLVEPRNRD